VGPPPLPLTLDRQLAQLLGASDREETGLDWRSLVTIDLDDDGVVDLAAIELASGEVWLVWLPH
jgi:hypothetical protein